MRLYSHFMHGNACKCMKAYGLHEIGLELYEIIQISSDVCFFRENRTNKNPLFSEEKKGLHHFLLVFFKKDDSDKEKEFVRQLQSFLPKVTIPPR